MGYFNNKSVLITGAANGMGRAFVRALVQHGAKVGALDLDEAGLSELKDELPDHTITTAIADVTNASMLKSAIEEVEKANGPTDILIANAGIMRETSAVCFDLDLFNSEIQVNLNGVANSISAVLPGMLERRSGQLVAMSSIASYRGLPPFAGYSASKAAVRSLCDAFRIELRPLGIRVTTLCPGTINTTIDNQLSHEIPKALSADAAVKRMLSAIARRRTLYTFPMWQACYVRLLRYLPIPISDWMVSRAMAKWKLSEKQVRQS